MWIEGGGGGEGEIRDVGSGPTVEGYGGSMGRILSGMGNQCVFSTRAM